MFAVTFLACVQLPRSLRFWGGGGLYTGYCFYICFLALICVNMCLNMCLTFFFSIFLKSLLCSKYLRIANKKALVYLVS